MDILNKLISPSLTRSIVYPALAAGFFYFGNMKLIEAFTDLENERQEIVASTPNLSRVRDLEYHFQKTGGSNEDVIDNQLRAEKENLLANPETNKGYALYQALGSKIELTLGLAGLAGMGAGLFGILGAFTGWNTFVDKARRKAERYNL